MVEEEEEEEEVDWTIAQINHLFSKFGENHVFVI